MISYCVFCKTKHGDTNWKYGDYENAKGKTKTGWYCSKYFKPSAKEWVPDRIKEDRNKYFTDLVQPWREGQPSKEFMDLYPDKAKKMFTPAEQKKAKPVWRDIAPAKFKATK